MLLPLQCPVSKHFLLSVHLGMYCWMLPHLGRDVPSVAVSSF